MRKVICLAFTAIFIFAAALPVFARDGHGHGRGGVFFRGDIMIGPGWGPWWGGPPYYPYYPYYPGPPVVMQQPQQPPVYVQPPAQEEEEEEPYYWYFCTNPQGYYPYVKECPNGWLRVVPSPVPPNLSPAPRE